MAALIPLGFLFWRFFLFQNERAATDVGLQLSYLVSSPLLTGMWWLVGFSKLGQCANPCLGRPRFPNI
jgi:hypothetical protein